MKKLLDLEQRLLLAESGELPPAQREELDRELAADPQAAAQREELRCLLAAAAAALPSGRPDVHVLTHLHAMAETAGPTARDGMRILPRPVVLHVLAYAAALVVALSAWLVVGTRGGGPNRIAEMHALVAVAGETEAAGASATVVSPAAGADADAELRALATQLLALEGLTPDEAGTLEADEADEATPDGAPSPTALQPRSIGAPAAGKYG